MKIQIAINKIEKETEKALNINFCVSWNGSMRPKTMWVPKSICEVKREDLIAVEEWWIRKVSEENTWKGYRMYIENQFTTDYINLK